MIIGQGRRSNGLDRRVGSSWFVLVLGKVVTSEPGCRLSFYGAESEEIWDDRARGRFFAPQYALKLSENEKNGRWVLTG